MLDYVYSKCRLLVLSYNVIFAVEVKYVNVKIVLFFIVITLILYLW